MLVIVRSPSPCAHLDSLPPTADGTDLRSLLKDRPQRCGWVVPTGRRARLLRRAWADGGPAGLLPRLHTVEGFVNSCLDYSIRQRPRVDGPERLLRVARAWHDVLGRPAGRGLVRQLDRFVRDWQAAGFSVPTEAADVFESVVRRYLADLAADHRLDRFAALRTLVEEVGGPDGGGTLGRVEAVLFDGFHRLERLELELIAALSRHVAVFVWLVGVPGQRPWRTVEAATDFLRGHAAGAVVLDHVPTAAGLSALGRRLFPVEPDKQEQAESVPGLFQLAATDQWEEVETVAKQIKADFRAAQGTGRPLRLSEVAVVVPGPAYDPVVRSVFGRVGLEFDLAGRALLVSASRPARPLTAALRVVLGQWRYDLLLDFLQLPLVRRALWDGHRLDELFEHRPRSRRRLDAAAWAASWQRFLARRREQLQAWQSGTAEMPARSALDREEFLARQTERLEGLARLVDSLQTVLAPVAELDRLLTAPEEKSAGLRELVRVCVDLLRTLRIERWLTPSRPQDAGAAVPWGEQEQDQQAYHQLLGVLDVLRGLPASRVPLTPQGRPDVLAALDLALDGATYQVNGDDGAGVQVFESREIRGLTFRHIYVLGLTEGQVPAVPEEGVLADRRRRSPALREQLQQKEDEAAYLFSQVFEAAGEKLVLSRTNPDAEPHTAPSPFLSAVEVRAVLLALPPARTVSSLREGCIRLGRSLRTGAEEAGPACLEHLRADVAAWRDRRGWPRQVGVEAPALLRALFPDGRPFSPSELETYAACPFRYFGTSLLGLGERDPDRTRQQYGLVVHRVLQTFYAQYRAALSHPDGEPLPAIDGTHRARLLELFEGEWELLDDGALPPDFRALFTASDGVGQLFLDAVAQLENEHGNLLNELVLQDADGNPVLLGADENGRSVLLTGKIDRVDLHRELGHQAVVIDYKTGRSDGPQERRTKMDDGRLLQLPLYAAALGLLRPGLRVVGGAYLHLSNREESARKALAPAGELLGKKGGAAEVAFDPQAARRLALELVGRIRAGVFSLTQHGPGARYGECTPFCDVRHACRHPDGYSTPNF